MSAGEQLPALSTSTPPPQQRKRKLSETVDLHDKSPAHVIKHTREGSGTLHQPHHNPIQEVAAASNVDLARRPSQSISHGSPQSPPNGQIPQTQNGVEIAANNHNDILEGPGIDDDEEDEDDDDDDASIASDILESAVHQFEDCPWEYNGTDDAFTEEESAGMRARLKEVGIEKFVEETMDLSYRKLGTIFGMDPKLPISEPLFTKLLFMAMMRAYRKREKLAAYNTIDDVVELIKKSSSIMVITGAGISTSLGIPDFRSKGTGFYDKIRAQGFETAEDLFEIHSFDEDPSNFYKLAGDLLPVQQRWTPTHAFIKLLQDNSKLQTNYTQNIDNLEGLAGILPTKLIQAHGSFATASCRKCKHQVPGTYIFPYIQSGTVAYCPSCPTPPPPTTKPPSTTYRPSSTSSSDSDDDIASPGVLKPDITFFNEALPDTFFTRFTETDAPKVDLVIVIGTSLKVAPVSEMCNHIPHSVPQVYISRESVRHHEFDVQVLGECDVVVWELARRVGWGEELGAHAMVPDGGWRVEVEEGGTGHFWVVRAVDEGEKKDDGHDGEEKEDGLGGSGGLVDGSAVKEAMEAVVDAGHIG